MLAVLGPRCAGLEIDMLEDLLTPDDEPEGLPYADGTIRLASTFSVAALREDVKVERGTPQRTGVLRFQPVELLAGDGWLISCWHPQRTFAVRTRSARSRPGAPKNSSAGWSTAGCTGGAEEPVSWASR